jgi:Flp pilus assembly protein TadG
LLKPSPLRAARRRAAPARRRPLGQSVVEFALIAPILLILVLAVIDVARIYTTSLSVESAAREAADYATFGSQRWNASSYATVTVPKMISRACVASKNLPDYVGPDDACTNPTMTYELSGDKGATWHSAPADVRPACDDETRDPPCWVRVTTSYDFHLIAPLGIDVFSVHVGFPNTVTLVRSSVFAMTDLSLPTPAP